MGFSIEQRQVAKSGVVITSGLTRLQFSINSAVTAKRRGSWHGRKEQPTAAGTAHEALHRHTGGSLAANFAAYANDELSVS